MYDWGAKLKKQKYVFEEILFHTNDEQRNRRQRKGMWIKNTIDENEGTLR
jgi:hypothetical protein